MTLDERYEQINGLIQICTDEFIKDLCLHSDMNAGEILTKCEDMDYNTSIDKVIKIMKSNPKRINNSGCLKFPDWPKD
jgi:hypothetical protein